MHRCWGGDFRTAPELEASLAAVSRGFQDELGNLVGMGDQREMAGLHLDGLGAHPLGHEALEIGIDRAVIRGNRIETRLRPPGRMRGLAGEQSLLERLLGRVGMWRGGLRSTMSVAAPFVWRCLSGSAITPFPHPAHRTQQADFPHCALGQDLTPSAISTVRYTVSVGAKLFVLQLLVSIGASLIQSWATSAHARILPQSGSH